MLPPKSKRCFGSLGLNDKMISLTAILQLWISHFCPLSCTSLRFHFHFPWREFPQILTPCFFQVHFSSLAGGKGLSALKSIKLTPQRANFPILAQRAQHRFISYQRESTGRATLVGISSSPLNAEGGEWAERQVARSELHLGSEELFRTHPETGSDEISSHMNREVVCTHPLPVPTGVRGGWWGESRAWGSRSWGEGRRGWWEAVGKVPVLSLTRPLSRFPHPSGAEIK